LGARVHLTAGKISQIREIAAGGSYLSQSDLRSNFGLGSATTASTVEVTWPSGAHQIFHDVKANQFYVIQEGRQELTLQEFHPKAASSSPVTTPSKVAP
jgi:hypothetical protein